VQKLNKQNPLGMNEGARRMIFFGVAAFPISVLVCVAPKLEQAIGGKAIPYFFWGILLALCVLGIVTYNTTPKRLILPLGIIGWLLSASILCWYGWFGPGAFRM
jgi:hypothetical protein